MSGSIAFIKVALRAWSMVIILAISTSLTALVATAASSDDIEKLDLNRDKVINLSDIINYMCTSV